jgi:hypothetical protein
VCVCAKPELGSHVTGCAPVNQGLGRDSRICQSDCNTENCTCAFTDSIPAGGTCASVCASYGLGCAARHAAGPRDTSRECQNFYTESFTTSCSTTAGSDDDVCVCFRR